MSITTYAELKTAVTNWVRRSDISSYLDDVVMTGEKHIFRRVRARNMESDLTGTIASGAVSLPSDFIELKYVSIVGNPSKLLDIRPAHWIVQNYGSTSDGSKPSVVGVQGGDMIFGPGGNGYTISGIYYARPASIASSVTDFFLENPDLYLYATLAELMPFLHNDKRVPIWMAKRDELIQQINKESTASHWGDAMAVRAA